MRNLDLWNGSTRNKIVRRLLDLAAVPLSRALDRHDDEILRGRVLPVLESAARRQFAQPCVHPRSFRVFSHPRLIHFCPDCGMGVTPPETFGVPQDTDEHYGEGFARGYHYAGARERGRHLAEAAARVNGILDRLGFGKDGFPVGGGKTLDYGCGGGRYAPLWLARGWNYVGIDPSGHNVGYARAQMASLPSDAETRTDFIQGDLQNPLLRDHAPFSMIFLSHVIEHVPDPRGLLADLRALSAPGGWLYMETPEARSYTWNSAHRGYRNESHFWDFTPSMLAATAAAAGWGDLRQETDPDPERFPAQALVARNPGD